jgi:hypothetical protein
LNFLREHRSEKFKKNAERVGVILLLDEGKKYKDFCNFFLLTKGLSPTGEKDIKKVDLNDFSMINIKQRKDTLAKEVRVIIFHSS